MQQQIALSGQSDCSVMEGEIGEEAKNSAHRSAGAGITPASHNSRLPWRQTCRRKHTPIGHRQTYCICAQEHILHAGGKHLCYVTEAQLKPEQHRCTEMYKF